MKSNCLAPLITSNPKKNTFAPQTFDFAQDKNTIMTKGPVSTFIEHHYRHFNAAALMDAAKGYVTQLG